MDKKQYNNIIEHTLNHEATGSADSLERARAIFKNMGVALPSGSLSEVAETLRTDDFMGWKACSMKEAQDAANEGTAAIGVSEERIVILAAADEEAKAEETDSVMTLSESTPALAVSDMQFYSYSYGDTTADNSNKDYRGKNILSSKQLSLLNYNKKFYSVAASKYGIPWKMLAAIHYREYGLRREGPSNGNGPYQIWGSSYPTGTLTDAQFQKATNDAAAFIKSKANGRALNTANNIKYTFFAYNGISSAYKTQALNLGFTQSQANNGEGSPYVMNRADRRRDPTVEPTKSNKTWGQIKTDGGTLSYPANSDYGAYVVYKSIK